MQSASQPVLTYDALGDFLKSKDLASYLGFTALRKMRGGSILPYAHDILGFLSHRCGFRVFETYFRRCAQLRSLQNEFNKVGRYPAASSREVQPIDDEEYKTALLLSFICTSHRFDILQSLVNFLRRPCEAHQEVLSIGYGTGYELKLAFDEMPRSNILAFDSSPESYHYASELLGFFNYSADCLRQELFPLYEMENAANYRGRFSRIVLCELLEHLDDPESALRGVRSALRVDGLVFATMAVNIAQEDHVFLYSTAEHARAQILKCGFEVVTETLAPIVVQSFKDENREDLFKKGNYICVARAK